MQDLQRYTTFAINKIQNYSQKTQKQNKSCNFEIDFLIKWRKLLPVPSGVKAPRIDCFHLGGVKINLLQTWTSAPGRDSSLEYRLSIYHARVNDTGSYTCQTPFEQEHTIKILVKEVSLGF